MATNSAAPEKPNPLLSRDIFQPGLDSQKKIGIIMKATEMEDAVVSVFGAGWSALSRVLRRYGSWSMGCKSIISNMWNEEKGGSEGREIVIV